MFIQWENGSDEYNDTVSKSILAGPYIEKGVNLMFHRKTKFVTSKTQLILAKGTNFSKACLGRRTPCVVCRTTKDLSIK